MIVQQMEPVVEVIDKRESVWDVVALWAEEQQHSQREIFSTAGPCEEENKTYRKKSINGTHILKLDNASCTSGKKLQLKNMFIVSDEWFTV